MKLTFRFPYWAAILITTLWALADLATAITRNEPAAYIAAGLWFILATLTAAAWRREWKHQNIATVVLHMKFEDFLKAMNQAAKDRNDE